MNITKENFSEFLPLIKDSIEESHFIAIDTELTGSYWNLGTDGLYNAFDTMPERYLKIQQNSSQFLIIQFGISCFQYHPKQKKYTHKDFNFYVFPKPHIEGAPDSIFTCLPGSIHFLISNGFDFNRVFREGITYLDPLQEENIKEHLKNKHIFEKSSFNVENNCATKTSNQKTFSIPKELKKFIKNIKKQLNTFMLNDSEKTIELDPCNAFRQKLIYQTVQEKYPNGIDILLSKNEHNKYIITIVKVTNKEQLEKLHDRQVEEIKELDSAVGFRKVIDYISQSKKLVVGHNMLLDIIHTLNQFLTPIPKSLEEFKQLVKCTFPCLIDTKSMASSEKLRKFFESTSLPEVLMQLQEKDLGLPIVEAAADFQCYNLNDKEKLHEAGYDAFITGLCYIGLKQKLGRMQSPAVDYVSSLSNLISPFVNKMFMMRHFDIFNVNLEEPDAEPDRENVFHVVFPKEWKNEDITELFSPYGDIYISWLSNTSALVALRTPDKVINVKEVLFKNVNGLYTVTSFCEFKKLTRDICLEQSIDQMTLNERQFDKDLINKTLPEKAVIETDGHPLDKKQE